MEEVSQTTKMEIAELAMHLAGNNETRPVFLHLVQVIDPAVLDNRPQWKLSWWRRAFLVLASMGAPTRRRRCDAI